MNEILVKIKNNLIERSFSVKNDYILKYLNDNEITEYNETLIENLVFNLKKENISEFVDKTPKVIGVGKTTDSYIVEVISAKDIGNPECLDVKECENENIENKEEYINEYLDEDEDVSRRIFREYNHKKKKFMLVMTNGNEFINVLEKERIVIFDNLDIKARNKFILKSGIKVIDNIFLLKNKDIMLV